MTKSEASSDVLRLKQLIDSAVEVMPRTSGRDQDSQSASIFIGTRTHTIPEALILDTSLSLEERALYQIMLVKTLRTGGTAAILYSRDLIHVSAVSSPKTLRRYQSALRLLRWITRAAQARDRGIVWAISDEPLSLADVLVLDPHYLAFVNSILSGSDRRLRALAENIALKINTDLLEGHQPFKTTTQLERAAAELDRQANHALAMQHNTYAVDTTRLDRNSECGRDYKDETQPSLVALNVNASSNMVKKKGLGKIYLTPVSANQVGQKLPNPHLNDSENPKLSTYPQASRQNIPLGGKFYPTPRSSSKDLNLFKNKTTTEPATAETNQVIESKRNFFSDLVQNFVAKENNVNSIAQAFQKSAIDTPAHPLKIDLSNFPGAAEEKPKVSHTPSNGVAGSNSQNTTSQLTPLSDFENLKQLEWPRGLTESERAGFVRILKNHNLEEAQYLLHYYSERQRRVSTHGLKPIDSKVAWLNGISKKLKNGEYLENNWVDSKMSQKQTPPTQATEVSLPERRTAIPAASIENGAGKQEPTSERPIRAGGSLRRAMESLAAARTQLNVVE